MTTPIAHGYPDWGRQSAASDIRVLEINGLQQNIPTAGRGTFFVGNSPYIWIILSVDVGGLRLSLNWRDAASGGVLIASDAVDTLAGRSCDGPIAVKGPYLEIFTNVDLAGRVITVRIWHSRSVGQDHRANQHNGLIAIDAGNVNAGATQTFNPAAVRWGWGYWNTYISACAVGSMKLYALDYLGAVQLLGYWEAGFGPLATLLVLPPRPIQSVTFNGDAVARTYFISVYCHPGPL